MTVLDYPAGTAKRNCEQTSAPLPNVAVSVHSKGYCTTSICSHSAGGILWAPTIPT
jgi:hypothetical protein